MSTNGHTHAAPPILLTISGFDPSCGAGTAADLKTFAAHGCYGVAAITSLTVQNTQGVEDVHNIPSATLKAQLEVLAKDCNIAAVKIGMLGNRGNAVIVAEFFVSLSGLGGILHAMSSTYQMAKMFAPAIILAAMGIAIDGFLTYLERRMLQRYRV